MDWKELNKEINQIILMNKDIENLVEDLVEFLDGENLDQDDKERAEVMLYAQMDETGAYKTFVRRIKPRLRKILDVAHFDWHNDDDPEVQEEELYGLSDDQIEGGVF